MLQRVVDDREPLAVRSLAVAAAGVTLASFAAILAPAPAPASAPRASPACAFVWLEGEDAVRTTFNRHAWYSRDGVRLDLLSPGVPGEGGGPGDWLAHYANNDRTAEAGYEFEITESGRYTLWFRGSVYQVRQWYRLDDGPQLAMDLASDPRERTNLLQPGRIDIRFLAWVKVAEIDLAAGRHTLTVGVEHDPARQPGEVHGGIDALVLVDFPWSPSGAVRPSIAPTPAPGPSDWFPFVPADDPLSPDSVTDVHRLLHRPAGIHGPVRRSGDAFVLADGTPIRFWGVNAAIPATPDLMTRQARFLASHGIDLVRLHPVEDAVGLLQRDPATRERRLDEARLDRLDRWFATLRAEGIYADWSPFYPHVITPDDGYPADLYAELPDHGAGKSSSGHVNYIQALQDAEWAWLRTLLDHRNPYTGLRYVDDPALAVVEVHNEDSVFWHAPLNDLAAGQKTPRHTAAMQAQWQTWLRARYPDDIALLAAWGAVGRGSRAGDSLANAAMPIYGAWEMAADGPAMTKAEKARMGDFIRFLAETQAAYYARRIAQLRELGFRGVTVTTAWQAGGPAANAANLWTDDVADAIDRHAYFGGGAGGHSIAPGAVENESHVALPGSGILGIGLQQVEDKPFVVSEWNQNPPNEWRAESAPLVAFYGMGLQGWDAAIHFTAGTAVRYGGGWPDLRSYVSETPVYMGQFPALALAVHRGDVPQGDLVAARRIALDDVFRGVDAFSQRLPGVGYDPADRASSLFTPFDTLAMGRVTAKVGGASAPSSRTDWTARRDADTGVVTSVPGGLAWDSARRVVTVRTERTSAIIGRAAGGVYPGREWLGLGDFQVKVLTPFVSLIFTSLDDLPLSGASRILVTALARDRHTGAAYSADGTELLELGGPPLLLEPVRAEIVYQARLDIVSVRPLDVRGVPRPVEVERDGDRFTIDGRYAAYAYEIRTTAATSTPPVPGPGVTVFLPRADAVR